MGKKGILKTVSSKSKNKNEKEAPKYLTEKQKPSRDARLTKKMSRILYSWLKKKRVVNSVENQIVLNYNQFEIKGMICEGAFGKVYAARNIKTNLRAAAKLEPKDTRYPQLYREYRIYEMLGSETPGFIKIYYYGVCDIYNVMIMELLGPDLDDLFLACNEVFSYKTVLMIASQTIQLLEYVHKKRIIYRDIKPENFCIGHRYQRKENIIYIIDFGLSKLIESEVCNTGVKNQNIDTDYVIGTARYMSVNAHSGFDQSKRDDLESLCYMYAYFLYGKLPWMGLSRDDRYGDNINKIAQLKEITTPRELFPSNPEFARFIKYVKRLQYMDNPDYDFLKNLIQQAFEIHKIQNDRNFDWCPIMNKKYLKKVIQVDPDD